MRHTRQGCARGQKHGTLDREDPDIGDGGMWAATSHTAMKEQGRVPPPAPRAKLRTIAVLTRGCWCGLPHHDGPHAETLPWQDREALETEAVDRLTNALVKVSLVAGRLGVGVAILCERGVPKFVAPCDQVPLGEVKWFGSVPYVEKNPPPESLRLRKER